MPHLDPLQHRIYKRNWQRLRSYVKHNYISPEEYSGFLTRNSCEYCNEVVIDKYIIRRLGIDVVCINCINIKK